MVGSPGKRLRILRTERRLTQKELGDKLGVSEAAVSQYESDKREMSQSIIIKITEIFCVSSGYILGLEDGMTPERKDLLDGQKLAVYMWLEELTIEQCKELLNYIEYMIMRDETKRLKKKEGD